MAALDFYFDYRSPYAYLAQTQVRKLGVEIAWRPFEILQLMDQVGNVPTIRQRVMGTEDAAEGIRSFVERRAAVFQGR